MPRVYAPTPFRWTDGIDYPFGYFDMPDDSKARAMKSGNKVFDSPGDAAGAAALQTLVSGPGIFLTIPALSAELGKAASAGLGCISFSGDSTSGGTGASDPDVYGPAACLGRVLQGRGVPLAGTGMVGQYRESANSSQWTGAGWSDFGRTSNLMQGTAVRTFTSKSVGTVASVLYGKTGGNFNVSIDGGANTLVTCDGSAAFGTYTVTGLANATHTITIAPVAAASHIYAAEVRAATGLRIHNFGVGGAISSECTSTANWFTTLNAVIASGSKVHFLRCGINDPGVSVPLATTVANIMAGCAFLKANGVLPVILTQNPYQNNDATVTAMAAAIVSAALAAGYAVFDSTTRVFKDYPTANALGLQTNPIHPNDAGYSAEAVKLCNALLA